MQTRLQVILDPQDKRLGEKKAQALYGLNLSQALRLMVKSFLRDEFRLGITPVSKDYIHPDVVEEILAAEKAGLAKDAKGKLIEHASVEHMMKYLDQSDENN